MEAQRLAQMLRQCASAGRKRSITGHLFGIAIMRIRLGVFQLNATDGYRLCRTQETDVEQGEEAPFAVDFEELHTIVQKHKDGSVTVMPHGDEVRVTFDDGVEYKMPTFRFTSGDYICDMEPHPQTRWAAFETKTLRKLFTGWDHSEACYLHMDGMLTIKRMRDVVHQQPCDFGTEVFVEVNPRYMLAALKTLGKSGYLGLHPNRICIADTKAELPRYMHIIMPMKGKPQ